MTKIKFLLELNGRLSGLPKNAVEERLGFYSEMIEDRIEDGLSEEEAVAAVGSIDEIAEQITADIPLTRIVKDNINQKSRLRPWEITLIVLGFPIWLSLLVAAVSVIVSLYAVLWSVVVSLWAVFITFTGTSLGALAYCAAHIFTAHPLSGAAMLGAALVCAGFSILSFCGCKSVTKGVVALTKKIAIRIKKCFIKKEGHNE